MRLLDPQFMDDLQCGILEPLLERVRSDSSICLEIREDYINLYYRGGNLLKVSHEQIGYDAWFDTKYAIQDMAGLERVLPSRTINSADDCNAWIENFPILKNSIDLYFGKYPKEEREAQQQIVTANNNGSVSRATDYFICDIEYANPHGRFDMVAVHWPSTRLDRVNQVDRRLVFVEVKFGDGSLTGTSGLNKHVADINAFLEDRSNFNSIRSEMKDVFNQKHALGLMNNERELKGISSQRPLLILVILNHDPEKSKLKDVLLDLPEDLNMDIHIATGCFMGHGLFDQAIHPLEDVLEDYREYIYDR